MPDRKRKCECVRSGEKRNRKANFSHAEVKTLLKEIMVEKRTLLSTLTNDCTNTRKEAVWRSITAKVNTCGVAVRTSQELRDKWKNMKGDAVKKRQRAQCPASDCPPPDKPSVYDDYVLTILGEKTGLKTGVSNVAADTKTCATCTSQVVLPQTQDFKTSSSRLTENSTADELQAGVEARVSQSSPEDVSVQKMPDEADEAVPVLTSVWSLADTDTSRGRRPEHLAKTNKKKKLRLLPPNSDNSAIVDEFLRSEIERNKVKIEKDRIAMELMQLQKKKVELELALLQRQFNQEEQTSNKKDSL